MAKIRSLPLRVVGPDWIEEVPSPPHDALTPAERRAHLKRHPLSYLGVTRAPEDAEPGVSMTADDLLSAGRDHLERLLTNEVFVDAGESRYYLYRLDYGGEFFQTGVVCGVAVDDYDSGVVKIHEKTKSDRANHLARHLGVVGAQSSPIALAYDGSDKLTDWLAQAPPDEVMVDLTDDKGLRQRVWAVAEEDHVTLIESELAPLPLYLIDGHHRAAAASTYRAGTSTDGASGSDDWMLCAVFPLAQLRNKAFHRVVCGIDNAEDFRARLTDRFKSRTVTAEADAEATAPSEVAVRFANDDTWLVIDLPLDPREEPEAVIANLDTVRLSDQLLGPVLSIDESNPDGRLGYQPGWADADALATLDPAADEAVFVMHPVPLSELVAASDAGLVMPPKSTYFEPKVRSGLFLHLKDR